ncbi:histone-lysine N-methyltransferase [Tanacetum coccineum]
MLELRCLKDFMAFALDKDRVGLLRFASAIIRLSRGLGIVVVVFNSVCGSGAIGEPEGKGEGQCGNMRLLQKQRKKVLMGQSDVDGWGIFLQV